MGTKVQCNSYFPGYCSMRDLNEDADSGSWPIYHEDKMLMSRQYYNGFLPRPATDGHSEYDKEVLKQTMLRHEAIFRSQVSELHRLYRIQRNLMEELKRKEEHRYPIPVEASPSMFHSSQVPFEDDPKLCNISSVHSGKSSCNRASVSGTDNMQSHSEFMKGRSMQGHTVPTQNEGFKDRKFLESNSKNCPRRMFDLQLPADEYIDNEEGECTEEEKVSQSSVVESYPHKKNPGVALDNNVNLSLGSSGSLICQGGASNSDLCFRDKPSLADLNHPIQVEEAASSSPISNFLGPAGCRSGTQGKDLPVQQNSGSLGFPRELFPKTRKVMDSGSHNNVLPLENMAGRLPWPSYNFEAGQSRSKLNCFSQGFGPEELPTISKPIQMESRNTQLPPFLMADQSERESWRGSAICGTESSKRNQSVSSHNISGSVFVPHIPSTNRAVHDVGDSGSSSFSSWRKPTGSLSQNLIAVQALPCPSTSAQLNMTSETLIQNSGLIEAHWNFNGNTRSNSSFGSEISYRNGFLHGSHSESNASQFCLPLVSSDYLCCSRDNTSSSEQFENRSTTKYFKGSECRDVKSAKDLNLNIAIPNGFLEGMASQRDAVTADEKGKNEDRVGGLPWLRMKPACNNGPAKGRGGLNEVGFGPPQTYSQQYTPKVEIERVLTPTSIQDSSSASITCNAEDQRFPTIDCLSGKRILGFPIFEKPEISKNSSVSFSSKSLQNLSEIEAIPNTRKVRALNIDLTRDPVLSDSGQQQSTENVVIVKELEKSISGVRNHFNLNSCADEEEPSTCSVPKETVKIATGIDLEAPVFPETAEVIPLEEESDIGQLKISAQSSQVELQDPSEELVRIAAEAIIIISSSGFGNPSDDVTGHPSETSLSDSLHWFAEVVSSHTNDLDGKNGVISREKESGNGEESSSDESDYFETMTLKLTETKVDEYWCKPWAPESQKEEETCVSSLLPTRRRRGQARRGRQRRDFQRDILPGLASLSRHEVTEDLQIIGGLMRATGHTWQTGVARRNAARNGWARGRRRTRNVATTVEATIVCSPPTQQANTSDLGLEERSLKGWGKTTRRPRRQRLAAGNVPIPLTQV